MENFKRNLDIMTKLNNEYNLIYDRLNYLEKQLCLINMDNNLNNKTLDIRNDYISLLIKEKNTLIKNLELIENKMKYFNYI